MSSHFKLATIFIDDSSIHVLLIGREKPKLNKPVVPYPRILNYNHLNWV